MIFMQSIIESLWNNRELLKEPANQQAIRQIIDDLDNGKIRVAEPKTDGTWQVNDWIKKLLFILPNSTNGNNGSWSV